MTGEQRDRRPMSSCYQIRIRGHFGSMMRRAFALHAETRGPDTLLQGVADQAALHGALARIEALGLELLEIRCMAAGPEDQPR